MDRKNFYERLKELAEASNKSFNQVEKELGYSRNALSNYKNKTMPSAIRLLELAEYFDVTPQYLMGYDDIHFKEKSEDSLAEFIFKNLSKNQKLEMYRLSQEWLLDEKKANSVKKIYLKN
ncbi:helix-turn-helix domain-containing protein [Lactococcus lactis]|uniref:helix-turn-helix domain-containing protein n=1 Tax=Lactococcus lactis TaxID=1358 RepID=UPI00241824D2|nr:helix-turn-helix transcriptional regulator [Lactococcus lactis]MDG4965096.1 helix-turn-helix domain-containing protein [Lactococcus lactis]